jgi:rod shape-determining protein MreC
MYNLLEFFRKYYYIFIFLALEAISFWLLFRFNSFQGSVWLSSANEAVATIDQIHADCESYLNLKEVNRQLTETNLLLQKENHLLREMVKQAAVDSSEAQRHLFNFLKDYQLIPAIVVSNSEVGHNNYLVINRGEKDGLKPEMGVVCGTGVVGIVYLTGENYSLVMPVIHRKSGISCRVREQNYYGYLTWNGKNKKQALVEDIPRYAQIQKGDTIETSGYSSVFPPGIYVGTIHSIENSSDGQAFQLGVNLGTEFSNLRDVHVIITPYKAEIDTLKSKALSMETAV